MKCPSCNQEISDDVKFCPSCGRPLQATSAPTPTAPVSKPKTSLAKGCGIGCLGVLAVFIILAIIGSLMPKSAPTSRENISATSSTTPKYSLTAVQLHASYAANQVAADAKYKDQLIKVSGVINSIGADLGGSPFVDLECGDYVVFVQCEFSDDDKESCAKLVKGQHVTIVGTCRGSLGDISLDGCSLVQN